MITIRTRGRLPHWEANNAAYFITFRLADSLPQSVLRTYEFARHDIVATARAAGRELSASERKELDKLFSENIELKLEAGTGQRHLTNPLVAKIVAEALHQFDRARYHLYAWCVMPNHVHALTRLFSGCALADVVHSWKSYSAKRANRLLARSGKFWAREYYDHLVRDEEEFNRIAGYILENPERAGLRKWPWKGSALNLG